MIRTSHFVIVAIAITLASLVTATTTMTPGPMNLKASSQENNNGKNNNGNSGNDEVNDDSGDAANDSGDRDGDGDDNDPSLTKESVFIKDGEVKHQKEKQSNEESGNAAVKQTKSEVHTVDTDKVDGDEREDPALTLNKVRVDKDGTVTEETKGSSEKSSKSASFGQRQYASIQAGPEG